MSLIDLIITRCTAVAASDGRTLRIARHCGEPWLCDGTFGIRVPPPSMEPRGISRFDDAEQKLFEGVMSAFSPDYRHPLTRSAASTTGIDGLTVYMLDEIAVSCARYDLVLGIWPCALWVIGDGYDPVFAIDRGEPVAVVMPVRLPAREAPRRPARPTPATAGIFAARDTWAEDTIRALLTAGLAAVERARREEREACADLLVAIAESLPLDTFVSEAAYQTLLGVEARVRARSA